MNAAEAWYISIHAPRTGSDEAHRPCGKGFVISIQAPRTGSDIRHAERHNQHGHISIHAPRTGSDACGRCRNARMDYFNPRSPHGERRQEAIDAIMRYIFQSTLPARGATASPPTSTPITTFQSTLPARGATWTEKRLQSAKEHFNPRSPHGERRHTANHPDSGTYFNPRSPHGERHLVLTCNLRATYFNPRSPHGERPVYQPGYFLDNAISIHAPRTGSDMQQSAFRSR